MLQIRSAAERDIPVIIEGLIAMVQAMEAVGGHPAASTDHLRTQFHARVSDRLTQDDALYLVAELDGKGVGVLEASRFPQVTVFQPCELLHIHAVYVDEAHRRRGIARHLIERAMTWGRKHGCTLVELNVLANNPAQHLYRALGFAVFQYEMVRTL
jgi:ribosomal protein S18 acetylase RimI-like enzyme